MQPIYLDHNAATPVRPEVVEAMARCQARVYANPASQHQAGQQARRELEDARERIAAILDVDLAPPNRDRLVFTSGGTEANNLAILGIGQALAAQPQTRSQGLSAKEYPPQLIISAGEHQSIIEPAEHLLEQGWRLDTLGLTPQGVVRTEQLAALLASKTALPCLVSIQLGNHETGAIQPIGELAAMCNRAGVPLHTDAVQAIGKLPVNFRALEVAAMSITAHKFRGPLGIGALILHGNVPIVPLMFGGHQQSGLRPGTESAALALGMAVALELALQEREEHVRRLRALRDRFEAALRRELDGKVVIHAAAAERLPQTSNVAFPGVDGQVLLMALDLAGVCCSVGSACASGSTELSPTLRAMDLPSDLVAASLRFSFGAGNDEEEVDEAVRRIVRCVQASRNDA